MFRHLRSAVSQNRVRFTEDGFDLDLTYITPTIIAMGFPSSGAEQMYRNPLKDVAQMLYKYHRRRFLVVNLAERSYTTDPFFGNVVHFPFPDHHSPPLKLLCEIVKTMHYWLQGSPGIGGDPVTAVHCLAGRGRTGTVIACYFLLTGQENSAAEAMQYFRVRRSVGGKEGVSVPSQLRYVVYFEKLVKHVTLKGEGGLEVQPLLRPTPIFLSHVQLEIPPSLNHSKRQFQLLISSGPSKALVFNSSWLGGWGTSSTKRADGLVVVTLSVGMLVHGDMDIEVRAVQGKDSGKTIGTASLHTGFVSVGWLWLDRMDIDLLCKKPQHEGTRFGLFFEEPCTSNTCLSSANRTCFNGKSGEESDGSGKGEVIKSDTAHTPTTHIETKQVPPNYIIANSFPLPAGFSEATYEPSIDYDSLIDAKAEGGLAPRPDVKRKLDVLKFRSQSDEKNEVPSKDLRPFSYESVVKQSINGASPSSDEVLLFGLNEDTCVYVIVFKDMRAFALSCQSFEIITELVLYRKKEEVDVLVEQSKVSHLMCFFDKLIAIAVGTSLKIFSLDPKAPTSPRVLPIKKLSLPSPICSLLMVPYFLSDCGLPSLFVGTGSGSVHGFSLMIEDKTLKVKRNLLIQPFKGPLVSIVLYLKDRLLMVSRAGEVACVDGFKSKFDIVPTPFVMGDNVSVVPLCDFVLFGKEVADGRTSGDKADFLLYEKEKDTNLRFQILRVCPQLVPGKQERDFGDTSLGSTSTDVAEARGATDEDAGNSYISRMEEDEEEEEEITCVLDGKRRAEKMELCANPLFSVVASLPKGGTHAVGCTDIISANVVYLNTLIMRDGTENKSVQTMPFILFCTGDGVVSIIPMCNNDPTLDAVSPIYTMDLSDIEFCNVMEDSALMVAKKGMTMEIFGPKGILSLK